MIVTTALVNGFKSEISRKIFNFWGHIQVRSFDKGSVAYDDVAPISRQQPFYKELDTMQGISHIQTFAIKSGIIKTDDNIEGLVLKGIADDFSWSQFSSYLIEGRPLQMNDTVAANEVIISQTTAERLHLKLGDKVTIYFVQQPPRVRRWDIVGIYKTGLTEYDQMYALTDIRHLQKLNEWTPEQVGGFEIFLDRVDDLPYWSDKVYYEMIGEGLMSQNLKEINPNIFEWLNLQDMNERVIITLLTIVALINMVTVLLILIIERTNMIGILKAIGADNTLIQRIFLYNSAAIVLIGIVTGNILGLSICFAQKYFQFIRLPEDSYYISVAPIAINWVEVLLINLATIGICLIALRLPVSLVNRIQPIKAIRFN